MLKNILNRKSIRNYNNKEISQEVYENITKVINSSATSINGHAFSAIIIKDEAVKKEISINNHNQKHIMDAQAVILFVGDLFRINEIIDYKNTNESFKENMILTASIDATIAASDISNYLLSENIGSCYLGGVRQFPLKLKEMLKLNENVFPVLGLTIGYFEEKDQHNARPKLNKVMNESYNENQVKEEIINYDNIMSLDYKKRDEENNWSQNTSTIYNYVSANNYYDEFNSYLNNIKSNENNNNIEIIGELSIKDGSYEAFYNNLKSLQEKTLNEKGCLKYSWYRDNKNTNTIFVHETWNTLEDLMAHSKSKHMLDFKEQNANTILDAKFSPSSQIL